ncbi:MAG: hypothetical protein J6333_07630, partial [Planctomycetes bacterium]|nr:hypothetical protein [Planctomycetota bacterium]
MRPVRFAIVLALSLGLGALAGEAAKPADPARQTLDKARAQIAAAAKGAKPGAAARAGKPAAQPAKKNA